ncbi:MAG: lamin tail domain-containing protein [Candidatus Omnitrophica bacterium]|nr:lamin tail domain-containing protein [Candidatus Omnitrophota bacterium]
MATCIIGHMQCGEILYAQGGLRITEIMGKNSIIQDEEGDTSDWVEIFNANEETVNLNGYGLSDDPEKPHKWSFPKIEIASGEYMIIYASGKDKKDPAKPLHTNFKISEKDESICLSDVKKKLIDKVDIDVLPKDVSFGLKDETGKFVYFSSPTPGKANSAASFSSRVEFSFYSGFYPEPLDIQLSVGNGETGVIHYTTDGSKPTLASNIYSEPLKITMNTTVRAISLEKGALPSFPAGETYFIGFDNKGIAALNISTENEKLWDPKHGLFRDVDYKENMLRDTVDVHLSYFDENGNAGISQSAKIGVVGASSREIMMRPLKITADETADPASGNFRYKLFPKNIEKYRHIQLRNNNQDGIRYLDDPECMPTMGIRNALFSEIVHGDENVEIRYDKGPVLFFINGENFGMMNIGEKRDNTGITENNPLVQSSDVDLVVIRDDMGMRIGRNKLGQGDAYIRHDGKVVYRGYFMDGAVEYEEISESAKQKGTTSAVDDFLLLDATDESQLDPKSFIASMAAHNIACNTDFGMNNIAFWRWAPVGEKPGPFHTYTFDFDSTFGLVMWREDYDCLLDYAEKTKLFEEFLSKEEYKTAFIRKTDEFLNGRFSAEKVLPIVDRLEKKMEPWIEHHLSLWADGKMNKEKWVKNVENIRSFVKARPKYVRMHLADFFGFSGYSVMEFLNTPEEKGRIYIDTGVFNIPLEGMGKYANVPMKIFSEADKGYKFSHFMINGQKIENQTPTIEPEEGMKVEAVYVKNLFPVADICINEVVRSGKHKINDEDGERQDWIEIYNTTSGDINLAGMYITDDELKLTKWKFPDVNIKAGDFMLIFASGKDRKNPDGKLHTNFKLSIEPVLIVDKDGETIIDSVTKEEIEILSKNSSGIKHPDGSGYFFCSKSATPGRANKLVR